MISRRSLLLGCVAALVASPCTRETARAVETFVDERNRFSFLVPDGYVREAMPPVPIVVDFTTTRFDTGGVAVIIEDIIEDIGPNGTLEDLKPVIMESIRNLSRFESGADSLVPTMLGNRPALACEYVLYDGGNKHWYITSVTTLFGTTHCTLSFYARNIDGDSFAAEIAAIHRSFTFLEGANTIGTTPPPSGP